MPDPLAVGHGPAIPVVGMVGPGSEIVGTGKLIVGDIGIMVDSDSNGIGFGSGPAGGGLRPLPLVSIEPIGIPGPGIAPGDAVDIVGDAAALLVELPPQLLDAGMPPVIGMPIVIPPPS